MWGFLVGAVCLYGLARTMRGGGWAYAHGPGHWGRRRWGGWRHDGWDGPGRPGGRGPLRWLFERIDTSPGQEKVIAEAADALRGTMRGWHDDAERMRSDVARSIRGETFDARGARGGVRPGGGAAGDGAGDAPRTGGAGPRGARHPAAGRAGGPARLRLAPALERVRRNRHAT